MLVLHVDVVRLCWASVGWVNRLERCDMCSSSSRRRSSTARMCACMELSSLFPSVRMRHGATIGLVYSSSRKEASHHPLSKMGKEGKETVGHSLHTRTRQSPLLLASELSHVPCATCVCKRSWAERKEGRSTLFYSSSRTCGRVGG